jgi:hypothetical protein
MCDIILRRSEFARGLFSLCGKSMQIRPHLNRSQLKIMLSPWGVQARGKRERLALKCSKKWGTLIRWNYDPLEIFGACESPHWSGNNLSLFMTCARSRPNSIGLYPFSGISYSREEIFIGSFMIFCENLPTRWCILITFPSRSRYWFLVILKRRGVYKRNTHCSYFPSYKKSFASFSVSIWARSKNSSIKHIALRK